MTEFKVDDRVTVEIDRKRIAGRISNIEPNDMREPVYCVTLDEPHTPPHKNRTHLTTGGDLQHEYLPGQQVRVHALVDNTGSRTLGEPFIAEVVSVATYSAWPLAGETCVIVKWGEQKAIVYRALIEDVAHVISSYGPTAPLAPESAPLPLVRVLLVDETTITAYADELTALSHFDDEPKAADPIPPPPEVRLDGTGDVPFCCMIEDDGICNAPTMIGKVCYDHAVMDPDSDQPMCPLTCSDYKWAAHNADRVKRGQRAHERTPWVSERKFREAEPDTLDDAIGDLRQKAAEWLTPDQREALEQLRARGYVMTPVQAEGAGVSTLRGVKAREQLGRAVGGYLRNRSANLLFLVCSFDDDDDIERAIDELSNRTGGRGIGIKRVDCDDPLTDVQMVASELLFTREIMKIARGES